MKCAAGFFKNSSAQTLRASGRGPQNAWALRADSASNECSHCEAGTYASEGSRKCTSCSDDDDQKWYSDYSVAYDHDGRPDTPCKGCPLSLPLDGSKCMFGNIILLFLLAATGIFILLSLQICARYRTINNAWWSQQCAPPIPTAAATPFAHHPQRAVQRSMPAHDSGRPLPQCAGNSSVPGTSNDTVGGTGLQWLRTLRS